MEGESGEQVGDRTTDIRVPQVLHITSGDPRVI